jgi:predicted 3-demethylubiquinone-9 3-methyltransferase (glyoxalase superfamily)
MGTYLGGSDPEGAQRATQAMLGMKKIDIAAMKAAYEGK